MSEETRDYELIYIIQPELDEPSLEALQERISQTISNQKGEIVKTENWGRRKLAYPIDNYFDGHYTVYRIQMPPEGVTAVEQALRYSEDVIRFLTMKADDNVSAVASEASTVASEASAE